MALQKWKAIDKNAKPYVFLSTQRLYTGIGGATGITALLENDQDLPVYKVSELIKKRVLARLSGRCLQNSRLKKFSLLLNSIQISKIDDLVGKTINLPTGTAVIKTIGFSTRVVSRG